jgi:hypothetical protein
LPIQIVLHNTVYIIMYILSQQLKDVRMPSKLGCTVKNPSWKFRNIFMKARTLCAIFMNFSILSYWFLNIHLYTGFGSKLLHSFFLQCGGNGLTNQNPPFAVLVPSPPPLTYHWHGIRGTEVVTSVLNWYVPIKESTTGSVTRPWKRPNTHIMKKICTKVSAISINSMTTSKGTFGHERSGPPNIF